MVLSVLEVPLSQLFVPYSQEIFVLKLSCYHERPQQLMMVYVVSCQKSEAAIALNRMCF